MTEMLIAAGLLVVLAIAIAAALRPRGSGGAPGENIADEPLDDPTPASWNDSHDAGGAEDRPGGPGLEAMHPDALGGSGRPPER